ncbi:MAG: hypothetical protein Q9213_000425 [Squamulea squamosa]
MIFFWSGRKLSAALFIFSSQYVRIVFADLFYPAYQARLPRPSLAGIRSLRRLPAARRSSHSASSAQRSLFRPDDLQNRRYPTARHQTTQAISANDRFNEAPPPLPVSLQDKKFNPSEIKSLDRSRQEDNATEFKKIKHLSRELVYLQDPLKLAENTIALLREDDNNKALDLVRLASKQTPCTVSWNHLVDYEMSKGRIQKAVKIYNEMKKRAQKPDAQTYTILLRGLSWHPHLQESLPLALKIYHSMFAENCPVKPNIIHTNAVLKVCALARDMDAIWGVAAKLPPKGPGAPNNRTFTTILNAIRNIAWHNDKDLQDEEWEEKSLRRQRAVMQGRKIWEEIIPRWRAGDIMIDEELVCAMGRLLLLGSTEQDYDDVLSLVEQVMALPRQKRRLGEPQGIADTTSATAAGYAGINETSQNELDQLDNDGGILGSQGEDTSSPPPSSVPILNAALANVFRPKPSAPRLSVARPGRNTLSLLLDACINLRAVPSAQAYWGLLTDPSGPYNVDPDSENFHTYLRVLRLQRASKAVSELIADMYSGELKAMQMLQPKTFRIAFSACFRDNKNPHVMEHATEILTTMYKSLPEPDLKALEIFVQLAASQVQRDFHITLIALRAMKTGMRLVRNYINYGGEVPVEDATKASATDLFKRLIGLYDSVLYAAGDRLEQKDKNYINEQKATLAFWVGKRAKSIQEKTRREKLRPRGEGEAVFRRVRNNASIGRHERMLSEKSKKGLGIGVRKRAERAREVRERSGEFDDFVTE